MRGATVAGVLLGLLAVVSAGDVSQPKHLTGRLTCLLPVTKIQCIRDWRSGFVAGVKLGYAPFNTLGTGRVVAPGAAGPAPVENWLQVCSPGLFNQTTYDMSVLEAGAPLSIATAQSRTGAASWYSTGVNDAFLFYPEGAPITQVIVLQAENPWGSKFGNIAAILFGYLDDEGDLDFAVCGNPVYANFFLNPTRAGVKTPPTAPTLKASYTSGLSEGDDFTALGSFDGHCGVRGGGYLGGDPWKSSKFRLKSVKKPCFTKFNQTVQSFQTTSPVPLKRVWSDFNCTGDSCPRPCHFDKKHNKKGPSYSCAAEGVALAVGKYGPIEFDDDGNTFENQPDGKGMMQMVKVADVKPLDGEIIPDEEDTEN